MTPKTLGILRTLRTLRTPKTCLGTPKPPTPGRASRLLAACLIGLQALQALQPCPARAAGPTPPPTGIPAAPSAPPSLSPPEIRDYFHCEREFTLGGRKYQCDSYGKADAEKLRLALEPVPGAASEIDLYQQHRNHNRTIAYVISAGVFAIVVGALVGAGLRHSAPHASNLVRDTSLLTSIFVSGSAAMYGLASNWDNEKHLDNAVRLYNQAHPDNPVEVQVKIGLPP